VQVADGCDDAGGHTQVADGCDDAGGHTQVADGCDDAGGHTHTFRVVTARADEMCSIPHPRRRARRGRRAARGPAEMVAQR
jgi:hypothetical protein